MKSNKKVSFRFIWGVFMVMVYLGMAYLVVFTPVLIRYNNTTNKAPDDEHLYIRLILGVVLFIYGLFRGYRMWKINR